MKTILGTLLLSATLSLAAANGAALAQEPAADSNQRVTFITSHGAFTLELFAEQAPGTVENFLGYVESGFYEGTIFHRVIDGFMVQGGGFDGDMVKKPTGAPIANEADNGLKNERGTVAMARTGDPHSATAQFFVNLVDNDYLDHTAKNARGWGYTVFAEVVEGMDVVDTIAKVRTGSKKGMQNVPFDNVTIRKVTMQGGADADGQQP